HIALFHRQPREQLRGGHGGPQDEHALRRNGPAVAGDGLHPAVAPDLALLGAVEIGHGAADFLEKLRLLPGGVGVSHHRHRLAPVEHPVAGGAVADAPAQKLRLAGKLLPAGHARRQHHSPGVVHIRPHADIPGVRHLHGVQHLARQKLHPRLLRVAAHGGQHLRAGQAGQAQVVVHLLRPPERIFLQGIRDHQGAAPPCPDVDGRGQPRGAAAD
ncbi:putative HTH-type transcriptional regulator yvdT, partial [Dysosmobacter welbionis]